jgi:hypothetical protein
MSHTDYAVAVSSALCVCLAPGVWRPARAVRTTATGELDLLIFTDGTADNAALSALGWPTVADAASPFVRVDAVAPDNGTEQAGKWRAHGP